MRAIRIGWTGLALAVVAGCSDRIGDYPALLPTDQVVAEPHVPAHAKDAATDPQATSAALSARAEGLRATGAAGPGTDAALAARAEALRARAAALRQTRLDCPDGQADCAAPVTPQQ